MPSEEMGAPAFRKFDVEASMPGRDGNHQFGEMCSTSNCTDYQSRRLNARLKDVRSSRVFVHTLNGTACAIPRTLTAIMEQGQLSDGSVIIPEVLRAYLPGNPECVLPRKSLRSRS